MLTGLVVQLHGALPLASAFILVTASSLGRSSDEAKYKVVTNTIVECC
jgi:hypothetical protein